MKKKHLEKISNSYIRYSNCWEDADILLSGLDCKKGAKILSIGSAGDNSFSLLCTEPELVLAVDINPVQIKLIELKKIAIKELEYIDYLVFYGFTGSEKERLNIYRSLKIKMNSDLIEFWQDKENLISSGLVNAGKFEKYFNTFSKKILSLIHTSERINKLFLEKSQEEQIKFYNEFWNNGRWRFLFKIFFSKFVMGRLGRSKEFMNEVKVEVGDFIYNKAATHLQSTACRSNYFLEYILKRKFDKNLPHYIRKENFEQVKKNINELQVFQGFAEEAFKKYGKFDYFNLSDIFEYMSPEVFKNVATDFYKNSNPKARFAYWNLMVPRNLENILPDKFEQEKELSENLSSKDKGFFYSCFQIDKVLK